MPGVTHKEQSDEPGLLGRLARDVSGNTLALGAAAMFPLAGIIGGGVDIGRMYMAKTRLQHACDAGALAGRRMMGGGSWAFDNNRARVAAEQFFEANWPDNAYGTEGLSKVFTESQGAVTGNASVRVPMTIMRIFDVPDKVIEVRCNAEMRLLNTDVMFVLDTTGSMAETISGDNRSKLASLRTAVKCFYQILAQRDIPDEDCEEPGNEPTGGTGPDVQLRFGFVPYSSNVNVGRLLDSRFFVDQWTYQSRVYQNSSAWSDWRAEIEVKQANCTKTNTDTTKYRSQGQFAFNGVTYCYRERQEYGPVWIYQPISVRVRDLKQGTDGWRASMTVDQVGDNAENVTVAWDGCIEERDTIKATSYWPLQPSAIDLDIDRLPDANRPETLWKPALPQISYLRDVVGNIDQLDRANSAATANRYYRASNSYACPTQSRLLASYNTDALAQDFENYVNSLNPVGNTYHDIGMIWGQRLLSPTGLFAAQNATSASGGAIERHLLFMTDGATQTSPENYTAYGIPFFERRQTDDAAAPTSAQLNEQVNKRFEALCERGKGPFTIWVIGFGDLPSETLTRLTNCASPGRFFHATSGPALQQAFRNIAEQIGQLRLRNDLPPT